MNCRLLIPSILAFSLAFHAPARADTRSALLCRLPHSILSLVNFETGEVADEAGLKLFQLAQENKCTIESAELPSGQMIEVFSAVSIHGRRLEGHEGTILYQCVKKSYRDQTTASLKAKRLLSIECSLEKFWVDDN